MGAGSGTWWVLGSSPWRRRRLSASRDTAIAHASGLRLGDDCWPAAAPYAALATAHELSRMRCNHSWSLHGMRDLHVPAFLPRNACSRLGGFWALPFGSPACGVLQLARSIVERSAPQLAFWLRRTLAR